MAAAGLPFVLKEKRANLHIPKSQVRILPETPTHKPHIEKTLCSAATLFAQFVSGYTGRSAEHRGRKVAEEPLWSLPQLQELLEEWLSSCWQARKHAGLRDPLAPGRTFSPNEKYAALVETAGYLPLALSAEDYLELLPTRWQAVNSYGVKISHRIYDSDELGELRRQKSGIAARKDRWEVRWDPYDVRLIWVRDHREKRWITARWRLLSTTAAPFGELAWDHAACDLRERGQPVSEEAIAAAVDDLLHRAGNGPTDQPTEAGSAPNRRGRGQRRAARTRAVEQPSWPRPEIPVAPTEEPAPQQAAETTETAEDHPDAEIIPLRVFDARQEAKKWW